MFYFLHTSQYLSKKNNTQSKKSKLKKKLINNRSTFDKDL